MANARFRKVLSAMFVLITACAAQLGTQINFPISNSTIEPGQKIDIAYGYQNMGNGSYVVDIDLWQDNTLTSLAKNIDKDVSVASGNSTGTQLNFYMNSTYSWSVPHGLNKTVYLTVTTKSKLSYSNVDLSMRSRAIVLHVNAGIMNLPMEKLGLAALSMLVLALVGFF
ncbi:hypothetical protein V8B55DRAFT_1493017 [Mucor lusitanicus]|uniref:Uncharacterized protein n=2 Tax=Mucor circinelloides f. lusitanicus TaxID=29924 RepID=A0A168MEW3_MUCCL|nr:hypothetical protein FB192DRAFT_1362006 [Mucor lusitanicus]OAD04831.1 hypothetical protein MUCCIDRAFT_155729 [Mucor lusitanicus CBS 277.49]